MPKEDIEVPLSHRQASATLSSSDGSSNKSSSNKSFNYNNPTGEVLVSHATTPTVSIPLTEECINGTTGLISSPLKASSGVNEGSSLVKSPTSPGSSKWSFKSSLSPPPSSVTSPSSPSTKKLTFTVDIIPDGDHNNLREEQQSLLQPKKSKPMISPSGGVGGSGGGEITSPSGPPVVINKHLLNVKDSIRDPSSTVTSMESTLHRHTTFNSMISTNNNENTITNTSTVDSTTFKKIRNRMSSKYGRMRKRVVFKNGDCNLHPVNISKRRRKYLADIFVTLVDLQVFHGKSYLFRIECILLNTDRKFQVC